jgi:predicted transglutaminase-like cysteine proteinase
MDSFFTRNPARPLLPLFLLFLLPLTALSAAEDEAASLAASSAQRHGRTAALMPRQTADAGGEAPAPGGAACPPAADADSPGIRFTGFLATRVEESCPEARRLRKYWNRILERHVPEAVYGKDSELLNPAVRMQWNNLLKVMPSSSPETKLQYINGFFNKWSPESDIDSFGEEEYWASPEEFLEKGGGDCEDYAIIKYLALRYFSWPEENLWIVLVMNKTTEKKHAALAARTGEKTFILCNLSQPDHLLIPEKLYMRSFIPLFALNGLSLWSFGKEGEKDASRVTKGTAADAREGTQGKK